MFRKPTQTSLFKKRKSDYGGALRSTRKGREGARPISIKHTMHLVLRSTQAKGEWSFRNAKHDKNIRRIVEKFAFVYGIRVISIANAWNHLHLQIKLSNRFTYAPFIKAITGAIAMSVTGRSRWSKTGKEDSTRASADTKTLRSKAKFWDHRPFTRIAASFREFLNLRDYVRMNQIEGDGWNRQQSREMVDVEKIWHKLE